MAEQHNQHNEWLSLIEISGPFLAEPVLEQAFPQGLEKIDSYKKKHFRQTYEEWREAIDNQDPLQEKLHQEWINWVLKNGLELDEDDEEEHLKTTSTILDGLTLGLPEHGLTIKPDYALFGNDQNKPYLLVKTYSSDTNLNDVLAGDGWSTSPAERMSALCRATGTRLGLLTNGEQWMLVDAPEGGIISYACWYARLWSQEPITLNAFFSLLNIRTVFNPFGLEDKKLPDLFEDSLKHQDEVTETLGEQVQRAVEVLIQSLDRINHDSNGKLLEGVEPTELYEAGLTFMMRLVFLLCAEERGLLLLGDETYEANYALSTLRMKLREEAGLHGEEVLSYRTNAWSRLLAIFRAVYGGVEHEGMRMPALGGSLFDPDRFPFLEGRPKDSKWRVDAAKPLPIDNRTVLLFLDAIQLFQGRTLSYRALDVEQIGYVYEGLLERTVVRSSDVSLELDATKSAKKPWVLLGELASAELGGSAAVKKLLKERTGSSASRITNDLEKEVTEVESEKLLLACQNDTELRDRIKPYCHFLRVDGWGNPMLYLKGAFMVATGTERRETGTHYTPKSLTEAIVKEALEPVAYIGPAEGKAREQWQLKSPAELLELKICDPAMGSGAFLVQACRWLSERLCESWVLAENEGKVISIEGKELDPGGGEESLLQVPEQRFIEAKRLVAERCLFGVDINPLAAELAKLSIWLVTLAKGRPFGFLDHNLRVGDALLGIVNLNQLIHLDMHFTSDTQSQKPLFAQQIEQRVKEALVLRKELRNRRIRDINDVEVMAHIDQQAREKLYLPELVANTLVAETLINGGKKLDSVSFSIEAGKAFDGDKNSKESLFQKVKHALNVDLSAERRNRNPFHWALEFPEVFESGGFNAIVGNPPFLGAKDWGKTFGSVFKSQVIMFTGTSAGKADLSVLFHRRSAQLLTDGGTYGLISTNNITEGSSIKFGLGEITKTGDIYKSMKGLDWPGSAAVIVAIVHFYHGSYRGEVNANGIECEYIGSRLEPEDRNQWQPQKIDAAPFAFLGVDNGAGLSFVIGADSDWFEVLRKEEDSILREYVTGDDITTHALVSINRWALDIGDMDLSKIKDKYPIAYKFLIDEVKPHRDEEALSSRPGLIRKWWQFWRNRSDSFSEIRKKEKVIAYSTVTKYPIGMPCNPRMIFTNQVVLLDWGRPDILPISLSSCMRSWIAYYSGGSLGATLRLSTKESFSRYPLPDTYIENEAVDAANSFYACAINRCKENGYGLTEIFNEINAENILDDEIKMLRSCLVQIDRYVLDAYGWKDIDAKYSFHESHFKGKFIGVEYSLADSIRDDIIRRLVQLNKKIYQSENSRDLEKPGNHRSAKSTENGENNYELFERITQ